MKTDKDWVGNSNPIFRTLGTSNHTDKERQNMDVYPYVLAAENEETR